MVNLFDIMRSAQSGEGLPNMGRQFGLSPADTQRAVEALLPALSLGFRRSLHDPNAFAQIMTMLSSGRFAPFFDDPKGVNPQLWVSGTEVLTNLLGSPQVSRKVAEQAAAATGVGVDILQQMLPMVAATIMGGAFRYASLEGLGDVFAQWSQAFRQAHAAQQPAPARNSTGAVPNPFEMWAAMMPSAAPPAPPPPPPKPAPSNPIEAWSSMVDAMLGTRPPEPAPAPPPPAPAHPLQVLSQMFEAGNTAQAHYVTGLQRMLDGVWEPGRQA